MSDAVRLPSTIEWRVHLRAAPETVFAALDSAEGRRRFWADSAEEVSPGTIEFLFANGDRWRGDIVERVPGERFVVTYFEGSVVTFQLQPDGRGGTDLCLTETGVVPENWHDNYPGWVSVLMSLKAAVDHGIDLRNHDIERTWSEGYVDV
jgi:uncharacterized protein YndB with AHSA1/START domain